MKFVKIKNTDNQTKEVNLDSLAAIEEQQYTTEVVLNFGGYFITVDQDEYKRIREMLEENKNETPIDKLKDVIYRATYLDSDAKLQLIMQLETIK